MKTLAKILYLGLCFFWSCGGQDKTPEREISTVEIANLKTEGLADPVGIDTAIPRFSWQFNSDEYNVKQLAYQVLVASSREKLNEEEADLWNSGKVESDQNIHVTYKGKQLKSKDLCFWKVKVWTNKSICEWSDPAQFGISLLHYKDWWGRWVGFERAFPWEKVGKYPIMAARYFRKEFEVKKEVERAVAYVAGLGLYEMELNGQKVDDTVLAPAPTDYMQNVKFNALDVTKYLKDSAQNAVGIVLGNGRFFAMRPVYKPYKIKHFGFPKLLFHMEIYYTDGSKDVVYSNNKWKGTADGPIRNNNEYDGEYYDARKELSGWSKVGFNDSKWLSAEYVSEPGGDYQVQMNQNMKVMREIQPVSITRQSPGKYIMDMGQNFSGWVQMKVRGPRGTGIQLKFAESLEENGELFVTNLRDAKATDTYILSGKGTEIWEPKFTYHGFRYVEITGYPGVPKIENFVGKMVFDEMKTVGAFKSSDATLNQIFKNSWWGIASNYKGMPVDCPQRNERQPWLGDHSVVSHGENFIFDNHQLYKKWLEDIRLSQKADGSISDVAPAFWNYYSDNMTWPGTMLIVAQMLYEQTGDVSVISENYDAMKKWLGYMKDRYMKEDYILTKDSYGDWCAPLMDFEEANGQNANRKYPSKLISTAYYYYFMDVMSQFAGVIGKQEDIPAYKALRLKVGEAFNQEFYNEEGFYGDNKMTDNILPLYFGLVNPENEQKVFDQLVETIEVTNKGHLSTGLIGTQWLMRTLTKNGRSDLALKLATNRTYPSWGYMLENGATAIWELWNGNVASPKMNSQNHVMMLGDLIVWYYQNLAGIKAAEPGFKSIEMKPEFDCGLEYVNASYESIQGTIVSHWKKAEDGLVWEVEIPANASANLYFPKKEGQTINETLSGSPFEITNQSGLYLVKVNSGKYRFSVN